MIGLGAIAFLFLLSVRRWFTFWYSIRKKMEHSICRSSLSYTSFMGCYGSPLWETARLIFLNGWRKEKARIRCFGLWFWDMEMLYLEWEADQVFKFSFHRQSSNTDVAKSSSKVYLETVRSLSIWLVYLLGVERVLPWFLQIGLSIWVYQSVRQKKWICTSLLPMVCIPCLTWLQHYLSRMTPSASSWVHSSRKSF